MQWLFGFIVALITAFIAAIADGSVMGWAVIGFFVGFIFGYVLNLGSRTTDLERQVNYLRTELIQLKNSRVMETPQAEKAKAASPLDFSAIPEQTSLPVTEVEEELPIITPANLQPEQNPWFAETVSRTTFDYAESEPKSKPHSPRPEPVISEPSDIEKLFKFIWNWFTDGNTFVRVGIVILFVGVSFLLNLAIDRGYIPIELRVCAVVAGAIALLSLGWRLRETRGGYALLIQGGAVGLLYLTIFASYNLYHLLPSGLAFTLLVLIVALSAALAVLENTVSLALFGSIGGFLAPILTSSGTNNYIGLFSFYAVLNAGVFAIAWFKAWRVLNLVGFTFTFSIGAFWGVTSYKPENFATVEPFLILFFLFYVGISILYATRRVLDFKDIIDGTLSFGTPILAFGLQAAMVKQYEYGVAISAVVLGFFYLTLARTIWNKSGESLKFLSETLLSICVIFLTLAIPFAVDGSATSASWAVESAGVLWVSIRQQHFVRRLFALGLQACAGIALLSDAAGTDGIAFFNSAFMGVLILSLCGGLSSWLLSQDFPTRRSLEKNLSPLLLIYSILWLFIGFDYQIKQHELKAVENDLMLSLTIFMTVFLTQIGRRLEWLAAKYAGLCMLIMLVLGAFVIFGKSSHPSAGQGLWLWPLAFGMYFWSLKTADYLSEKTNLNLHIFTGLFLAVLLFWEGFWQLLLIATLLSWLFNDLATRWNWRQLRILALGLFPVMLFLTFCSLFTDTMHPFELPDSRMGLSWSSEAGYLLWTLAFFGLYWLFYDDEKHQNSHQIPPAFRGLSLLLLVILLTWESSWHLTNYLELSNGWNVALFPLFAVPAVWLIMSARFWPFSSYAEDYLDWAAKPLSWGLMLWSILGLKSPANSAPLPWLPLINPAELMQAMVLVILIRFTFFLPLSRMTEIQKRNRYKQMEGFTFVWLNFMLLRAIHHWANFPWSASLLDQALTQTCLSIFWTLTGLSLTILATKKQIRSLWITGAALLVIVVLKLFLFDLHSDDAMERVISFITVGGLLMLIGYVAPLPPKLQESKNVD